ncbi:MAG: M48 family metallopeptidase [Candidatus Kapabacteria bacterium]|nr:M48 family metallopeptidase [Ignavibacteriota bacterium]MCW5884442.1 M48 family metallopeptidase [Candidatus Kapabacteria bacterium]
MIVRKIDPIVSSFKRVNGSRLTLRIDKQANVVISAPLKMAISDINNFIDEKRDWIEKTRQKIIENQAPKRLFNDGDTIPFLGIERRINILPNYKYAAEFLDGKFNLSSNIQPQAKEYLSRLFKNLAWNHFAPRIHYLAKQYNFKFKAVKISSAQTKWGSCSNHGNINLAWRLVMAPEDVIDYVIIHELAHTVEANHSHKFWKIVENIIPDYKQKRQWLKDNGKYLDL